MYRKGKYTKKLSPAGSVKRFSTRRWKWFKGLNKKQKALLIGGPILAFLLITPIATYAYYYNDIGNQERLLNRNNTGVVLLDRNGEPFYTTPGTRAERRDLIPLDQISDETEDALIASEDKDFYKHSGFDVLGIFRALYNNVVARGIAGGGSTLTQQLAKNTLLSERQTILRKYQELVISVAIEQRYSKEQILTMYLNSVYYGENSFGIEEAAKNYFNKKPSELTLAEGSMLVGVLPAPSAYSPISGDSELAKERQTTVLTRMVRNGYITEADKTTALSEEIAYAEPSAGIDNEAPHFTEMVLNELYKKYGEEQVSRSGYQVTTTLDLKLQEKANAAVESNMRYIEANGGSNASMVAIDPKTGGILSLVGSADYDNEEFGKVNMAVTARQPGSSFKPIYYADGLASGKITPTTVLEDKKTDFGGYSPENADRRFRGNVTVRQALNWSLNIPAIKVMQKVGIENSITAAKKLGISTLDSDATDYGLSLALGSAEIPLSEMTDAYAGFANQGDRYDKTSIKTIKNKYDQTIFSQERKSTKAISTEGAYLISNILSDNQTRSSVFGSSLNVTGTDGRTKTVAVKTGTTDDSRDAWTIGYTSEIAVGVWVGNNDNEAMANGGAGMAGPIWRNMMGQAIGSSNPSFTQPAGIVKATVCTIMGTKSDVFLSTKVPKQCDFPKEQPKEEKKEEVKEVEKCKIVGKENLDADDEKCVVDQCTVKGLEQLAANDPKCVEPTVVDTDGDGVPDDKDDCVTEPGPAANKGCPVAPSPSLGPQALNVRRIDA
ncbi:PBP1A family penicillin-binding protein [Candidatus Saccharibacteria bacterium]|nr:PBP1A family penicillin-binding protein [Candidatus Saccharibacteria bacterium]